MARRTSHSNADEPPAWWPAEGVQPDYRFSLANERTLLAYSRTALAALVAGAALAGTPLLTDGPTWVALLGALPLLAAAAIARAARGRFLATERAMRLGTPLPPPVLAVRITQAVVLVALVGGPVLVVAAVLSAR